ncbi:MAG TPA: GDSL-type esterase/lipase family protein [Caulifigura sp.]|nr:GDSL-type esterase/lipase family protein [Caulifigura sp.]
MILNDTFTAADGSLLTSHTADSGASYAMNPAGSGTVQIHSGRAHADGAAFPYSSVTAADCEIEGIFRCLSADGQYAGILGRMSTSSAAWYSLLLQFSGGVTLYGSSNFGSFPLTFEAGADYHAKLIMKGSVIRAFINGYEFQRVTNTEQATGRIGFCFGAASSESTGLHLDSLIARDQPVASQILFHGDSLTSGQGVITLAHADKYPTRVIDLLDSASDWANLGVGGRTLADLLANVSEVDDCRRPDAPSDLVVVWAGINDFAVGFATVEDVIDRLTTYADGRRTLGFQVVGLTIIAADEAHPNISPEFDGQRNEVNSWLRANWSDHFDALADVAADARLSDPSDETYYQTDGVHLAAAGAGVVAEIVAATIQSLIEPTLTVTAPTAGQVLLAGEPTSITWTSTGSIPTVRVELSKDGGSTWETIADPVDNAGATAWTPPDSAATAAARVRVSATGSDVAATSASFKIATTSPITGVLTPEDLAAALEQLQAHGDVAWGRNPILPVIARVNQDPVSKTTLIAYQRGRSLHQLVIVDATGAAVDLSAKSLQFTLETLTGATVASSSSVTAGGADSNIASFTASEAWHAQPGLYRYALRDVADGARVWARGDYLIEPTAGPV